MVPVDWGRCRRYAYLSNIAIFTYTFFQPGEIFHPGLMDSSIKVVTIKQIL